MDLNTAIELAQLVMEAYATPPGPPSRAVRAGENSYTIVATIYASDLATDMNPGRCNDVVSIGLILQEAGAGGVAIAIRGTVGILEWIHDAEFLLVKCPFLEEAGCTEDGFTAMYRSLRIGNAPDAPSVVAGLATLPFPRPISSVTVCGHSLGGALATLLALDLAANSAFKSPTVYTYASPRTGDPTFAGAYDRAVPDSVRIANRLDLVPKLPFPPFYEHVQTVSELNPVVLFPWPPKILVKPEIACEHSLETYLYLMSLGSGGPVIPLDAACAP